MTPKAGLQSRLGRRAGVRFLRAHRRVRAGIVEMALAGAGVLLGALLPQISTGPTVTTTRAAEVLVTVGFGVLGLVAVIFSLLFLVVQASNTMLSPRLNLFQRDPWIWRTFGLAIGLAAYSTVGILALGDKAHISAVVPLFAFAVALAIMVLMRNIQQSAFGALQLTTTLAQLQKKGRGVLEDLYPDPLCEHRRATEPAPTGAGRPVNWPRPSTTLEQLDLRRLLQAADAADAVAVFVIGVGTTLAEGMPVAVLHGGQVDDDIVLGSCWTGTDRTFAQDPLLAFRLLSDIGLRALSPAVNDPATGAQAAEVIVALLTVLANRNLEVQAVKGPSGRTRVILELPGWIDFIREGLDDLLAASAGSQLILDRERRALQNLLCQTPAHRRQPLHERLQWIETTQRSLTRSLWAGDLSLRAE